MTTITRFLSVRADMLLMRSVLVVTILALSAFMFKVKSNNNIKSSSLSEDQEAFVLMAAEIAMFECERTGIPTSITIAQAILESSWGKAPIAVYGNNFFGIKCKSWWQGDVVYHKDDDLDKNGNLIESCFRAYNNIEASFRDHSDFLVNSERYEKLFSLSEVDYNGWAHGLKSCGYATDKQYAEKLIGIIERLNLYEYDMLMHPHYFYADENTNKH